MTKKGVRFSIGVKILVVVAIAIAFGGVLFFTVRSIGNYYTDNFYISDDRVAQRCSQKAEDFQKFVDKSNVSYEDWKTIHKWVQDEKYMYLNLYHDNQLVLSVCSWYPNLMNDEYDRTYDEEYRNNSEYMFTIDFDGEETQAFIYDYSEDRLTSMINLISYIVACLAIVLIVCAYAYRIGKRITELSVCARRIEMGNLHTEINIKGKDEIAQLAFDIDHMRNYIVKRMEEDQRKMEENKELWTSVSHDIRTPLTAVIGYTDLILKNQHESPEQLFEYIGIIRGKALRLKTMTDQLFRYFHDVGGQEITVDIQEYDGEIILNQILGEKIIDLRAHGFVFECKKLETPCTVEVDAQHFNRVFDNLFDNITKYADQSRPIEIAAYVNEESIDILIKNYTLSEAERKHESTNIGLKTCERIMGKLGGSLVVEAGAEIFSVLISLPAKLKQKSET